MLHKKLFFILFASILFVTSTAFVFAQTPTETPTPTPDDSQQASDLQKQISELEAKVSELQSQKQTLSSQIGAMDNQIQLTEYRIDATNQQITDLTLDIDSATKRMDNLEDSLHDVTKTLLNRIVATYQIGGAEPMQILLASNGIDDFVSRVNYLRIVQAHDKKLLYETQQARNDYANQKVIFEDKKARIEALQTQLEEYSKELDTQKADKQRLLAETQGSEATYQRLLSEARAQLAGFSRFAVLQGGASLLGNQTACDDWGCYYNQRDSQWGGNSLNGTQYSLASDGCLVTSMAMIYTHYGHRNVTPQTINSISSNFASYYPAYLKFAISADGASSQRTYAALDSILASGHPAVVGISYDGGPVSDHFLVIVSGSSGNYTMKDPFTPNGNNIPFTSKYPISSINDVYKVVF
ncbi:MAG TPA: C39 family peptidase [Patescibacteria group bacterium]|nr:C39 family peptidase [Patescibacteria group bacterium]